MANKIKYENIYAIDDAIAKTNEVFDNLQTLARSGEKQKSPINKAIINLLKLKPYYLKKGKKIIENSHRKKADEGPNDSQISKTKIQKIAISTKKRTFKFNSKELFSDKIINSLPDYVRQNLKNKPFLTPTIPSWAILRQFIFKTKGLKNYQITEVNNYIKYLKLFNNINTPLKNKHTLYLKAKNK